MEIKTFRAKTMQQALNLVRSELGAEATVLHTRELNTGLIGRFLRGRQYEIAASTELAISKQATPSLTVSPEAVTATTREPILDVDYRARYRDQLRQQTEHQQAEQGPLHEEHNELHALAEQLRERSLQTPNRHLPEAIFQIYTDMIESDIEERVAQELVERLRNEAKIDESDPTSVQAALVRMLASELTVAGPIEASPGQGRVVALVGPTGVGKTTTIAKLAANYRLRENRRVGLITVDTYRIAAVEQLRTYADIIDLPMEIVSTPREMREAIARLSDLDLILMDTAGRSPRDEIKIQELKSMLAEAEPDEVHLVLSAVGGTRSLTTTAQRFATVGTTALLITKLDESTALGNLLSVTRNCGLPLSYLTDGQNVPDDIQVAQPKKLAEMILGIA
ncbi:MAG: flagellar biosynthesis protein FlhF [Planctomycetes bacterium]|nr:flagellar biosynthesis protein FlhF [Planctomycetota bacterium]